MGMLKRRVRPEDVIINCSKLVLFSNGVSITDLRTFALHFLIVTQSRLISGIVRYPSLHLVTSGRKFGTIILSRGSCLGRRTYLDKTNTSC